MPKPFTLLLNNHSISESGSSLSIFLPERNDLEKLRVSWDTRGSQQIGSGRIWLGGGGTVLINNRFVPLIQRSTSAPSYPGCLTVQTGLPDSAEELCFPQLLIREFLEELLIVNSRRELLAFNIEGLGFKLPSMHLIAPGVARELGVNPTGSRAYEARLISSICRDNVLIYSDGELINSFSCVLHFNEDTRAYNVIFPLSVDFETDALSSRFLDGEMLDIEGYNQPLRRRVLLYDAHKHILIDEATHEELDVDSFAITPHALEPLKRLRKQFSGAVEWSR